MSPAEEALLPLEVSTSFYRIAQEALANAFRHADASHVDLHLSFDPESVTLRISDDGRGFAQGRGQVTAWETCANAQKSWEAASGSRAKKE
jgi:signal transduction histidine kinase